MNSTTALPAVSQGGTLSDHDSPAPPAPSAPPAPLGFGPWALAAVALLAQLAVLGRYGWFRDELYYVACGRHLALGYVDHPPVVAVLAWLSRVLLGDSLPALRLLPALAGAAVVLLAALLARDLGGGAFAQRLAAVCVLIAPRFLGTFHVLSPNAFEALLWTLAALVVGRLAIGADPRQWLLFGALAGIGLETKHSMLFFGFGVAVGLLLTPFGRRALRQPWVYLGGALAALLFAPNLLWEVTHGWPTLEFLHNAQATKNLPLSPPQFFVDQVMAMQPATLPIWATGFLWLLLARAARPFRILGWIALTITAVLLAFEAKGYYLAPLFPLLFAAGASALEAGLFSRLGRLGRLGRPGTGAPRRWAEAAVLVLLLGLGAVSAPMTLPVLPVDAFVRYQAALGMAPQTTERQQLAALPQQYADMFGWPEMVADVKRAVDSLPAPRRARACILARNYGEAGALDELGRVAGLPPAISGHNNYFLWGPGTCDGSALVVIGRETENRANCADLRPAGRIEAPYAMPYENGTPLFVCRLRQPLAALWPSFKTYQ